MIKMIRIIKIIAIIILMISISNGVNFSATVGTNSGIMCSDNIIMNGDIIAHGEYFLGGQHASMSNTIEMRSGSLWQDDRIQADRTYDYPMVSISKMGRGATYVKASNYVNGQYIDLKSTIQTGNGGMYYFFRNALNWENDIDATWNNRDTKSKAEFKNYNGISIYMDIRS